MRFSIIPSFGKVTVKTVSKLALVLYTMDSVYESIKEIVTNGTSFEIMMINRSIDEWVCLPSNYTYNYSVKGNNLYVYVETELGRFKFFIYGIDKEYRSSIYLHRTSKFYVNNHIVRRSLEKSEIPYEVADAVVKCYLIEKINRLGSEKIDTHVSRLNRKTY
nr:MAG TPA: hypothetical protein [Caudoviricetes sp.]